MNAVLGIELGSTRIKACVIDEAAPSMILAVGASEWQNELVDGVWTYALERVWAGLRAAVAEVLDGLPAGAEIIAAGVSAMMHGYLAFDSDGELLVPFRTWRNTSTEPAAQELTTLLGVNIPLRWSIAHLQQAVRDGEEHIGRIRSLTTLAGYVHERLTGRRVIGVGDASGMFPIVADGADYDPELLVRYDRLASGALAAPVRELLPEVLLSGASAGRLTDDGAMLIDPSGRLCAGIPFCPPEGDAGTGMVATNAVAPRTGNVSAGTSIFAMVVLNRPLTRPHSEIDIVTTPAGDPVAMVHANNGTSELAAWAGLFARFSEAIGWPTDDDAIYEVLFREALDGDPDAGGMLAYNQLAGEPIAGLPEGRPLFVRTPDSRLTLANAMRAQIFGVFATLALGMQVLRAEGVKVDRLSAHGGMFRTEGVAQRLLAGALDTPVAVSDGAGEGGAWGMAVLAAYAIRSNGASLNDYLASRVFAGDCARALEPSTVDVAGFAAYLARYRAGLAIERAAISAL